MNKLPKNILVFCYFIIFLMLFACGKSTEDNSATRTQTDSIKATDEVSIGETTIEITTTIKHDSTTSIYEIGSYWTIYYDTDGSSSKSIIFKDKNGKEIYHQELEWTATVMQADENLFQIWASGGNELHSIRYFDVKRSLVSPTYWKPFARGFDKIAYIDLMDGDGQNFIVHDMFDPEANRVVFKRKNIIWAGSLWAPEAKYIEFPFTKAEFLDKNRLHVRYVTYDGKEYKFVEEVLKLN